VWEIDFSSFSGIAIIIISVVGALWLWKSGLPQQMFSSANSLLTLRTVERDDALKKITKLEVAIETLEAHQKFLNAEIKQRTEIWFLDQQEQEKLETKMSKKVLLVDDSEDTLQLVLMGVEAYSPPFEIKTALTASKASEMLSLEEFDALILDIALPDVTGTAFGGLIREKYPDIPIAFLTNYNGPQAEAQAEKIGAEFWFKPNILNNFDKLSNCIENLINGESCKTGE